MADLPNLAGVATSDLVEKIGGGNFQASYINWSRTMHMLRTHAPGWLPELVRNADGGMLHRAPAGSYLLIRFRHTDGSVTPEVPQAVMDTRNNSVPLENVTARDITDTHRRGVCMAAAFTFGLAYELWAKMPLETGYAAEENKPAPESSQLGKVTPMDGVWDAVPPEEQAFLRKCAAEVTAEFNKSGPEAAAYLIYVGLNLSNDEILAMWSQLDSKVRNQSKKFKDAVTNQKEKAA